MCVFPWLSFCYHMSFKFVFWYLKWLQVFVPTSNLIVWLPYQKYNILEFIWFTGRWILVVLKITSFGQEFIKLLFHLQTRLFTEGPQQFQNEIFVKFESISYVLVKNYFFLNFIFFHQFFWYTLPCFHPHQVH
jgi:hypothetical protein